MTQTANITVPKSVNEVGITMYTNRCCFRLRLSMIFSSAVLCLVVAAVFTMGGPVAVSIYGQTDQVVNLSVNDPRPVAKALGGYGWITTYEDPPYIHQGDIQDVTEQVRKDLHKYPPGKPRVLGPKGGQINISYSVNPQTRMPDKPAELIQRILDDHAKRGNPGVFRLMQTGQIFHVVPAMVKNSQGQWVAQGSVLDVLITLPEQERAGMEMLAAICADVSETTRTKITVRTFPMNLFFNNRSRIGGASETAREVLLRFLKGMGRELSWALFYDPTDNLYALNVYLIRKQ
jgi:hypothetical protein